MNTQKTLTMALATLGLFGVAGAAFLANGGATSKSEPLIIRNASAAGMTLVSDVPADSSADTLVDELKDGAGCGELYAEQQAGPRGGQIGGGQQGGPGGQMGGPGGPGMQMRGGPQGPMILRDPKVQQELNLSQDQIAQIQQALEELRPQGSPGGPGGQGQAQGGPGRGQGQGQGGGQGRGGQGGPGGQGQGRVGGGQGEPGQGGPGGPPNGQMGEQMKQFDEKLKTILNQNQFNRYQQLSLQSAGPNAFNRPDVAEKLGITQEQREQMREIMEANRPEPPMPPQGGGQGEPPQPPDPAEMKAKQEALMTKLLGVLTASQRSQWQTMIGAKFEFSVGQPPRPGGGGQGGPGGGRRGGGGGNGGGNGGGGDTSLEDASIVF